MKSFIKSITKIDNILYDFYSIKFNNLYDLYNYLKSNPKINDIFTNLHSINASVKTHGKPYNEALYDLININDKEYINIVKILENTNDSIVSSNNYKINNKVCGGKINVRKFVTGNPLCYEVVEEKEQKYIKLNVSLSYNILTTNKQLINRALIISSLVNEFENMGYKVDLNTFHICKTGNEIIYIDVQIKNEKTNLTTSSLYNSLCKFEFLRRILLRVLETSNVKNTNWGITYGDICDEEFVKKALMFEKNDIYFGEPKQLGIKGTSLLDDFNNLNNNVKLDKFIDLNKTKENIKSLELKLKK